MPDDLRGPEAPPIVLSSKARRSWLLDRLLAYWQKDKPARTRDRPPREVLATPLIIGVIPSADPSADRSQGIERRLVYRILRYWQQQRGARTFPSLDDINPEDIVDLWPSCFVLETQNSVDAPYFQYLGASLAKYSGVFLSGEKDWSLTLLDKATLGFRNAIEKMEPLMLEDEITRFDGTQLLFRSILLPLSDNGEQVDHLLGAANGKIMPAGAAH